MVLATPSMSISGQSDGRSPANDCVVRSKLDPRWPCFDRFRARDRRCDGSDVGRVDPNRTDEGEDEQRARTKSPGRSSGAHFSTSSNLHGKARSISEPRSIVDDGGSGCCVPALWEEVSTGTYHSHMTFGRNGQGETMELLGIHHLTAISAQIRENKRFFTETLGMRLVKRSVNQDDVSACPSSMRMRWAVRART